jgi:hypothetical protein
MDLPGQRALIQSRIDNLKESQENLEKGKIDSYSRRYANVMGALLPNRPINEPIKEDTHKGAKNLRELAPKR